MTRKLAIFILAALLLVILLFLVFWELKILSTPDKKVMVKPILYSNIARNANSRPYKLSLFKISATPGFDKHLPANKQYYVYTVKKDPVFQPNSDQVNQIVKRFNIQAKPTQRVEVNSLVHIQYYDPNGSSLILGKYNSEIEYRSATPSANPTQKTETLDDLKKLLTTLNISTETITAVSAQDQLYAGDAPEEKNLQPINASYTIEGTEIYFDSLLSSPINAIWNGDELIRLFFYNPVPYLQKNAFPIKSVSKALQSLQAGNGTIIEAYTTTNNGKTFVDLPNTDELRIDSVTIKYYLDRTLQYGIQPVYEFHALAQSPLTADKADVIIHTSALQDRFIAPGFPVWSDNLKDYLTNLIR